MRTTTLSLLAAALLAPLALAQETASLEDAALDAMPPSANAYADIVGGTMTLLDARTARLTIELTALPEMTPGMAYLFLFSDGTRELFGGAITAPTLEFIEGTWLGDDQGPGGMGAATGAYTTGPGGTITIDVTLENVAPNATSLFAPRIFAADIKGDATPLPAPILFHDTAEGDASIPLPARNATVEPESSTGPPAETSSSAGDDEPAAASGPSESADVPLGPLAALAALAAAGLARGRRRP